jgi:hypothetical protein
MIAAVHALTGAALGRLCGTRAQAFAAGLASHAAGDALPHRDLEVPAEALLLAGAFGLLVPLCGAGSREFAGALGAVLPDAENLVGRLLDIPDHKLLWPTHRRYHGRKAKGFGGQAALALASLALLAVPRGAPAGECGNHSP